MELKLQNDIQHQIADLLWAAKSMNEVRNILQVFGHDARVVYEMMVAATFDEVNDTAQAKEVLAKFRG